MHLLPTCGTGTPTQSSQTGGHMAASLMRAPLTGGVVATWVLGGLIGIPTFLKSVFTSILVFILRSVVVRALIPV